MAAQDEVVHVLDRQNPYDPVTAGPFYHRQDRFSQFFRQVRKFHRFPRELDIPLGLQASRVSMIGKDRKESAVWTVMIDAMVV